MTQTQTQTTSPISTPDDDEDLLQVLLEVAERASPDDLRQAIDYLRACDEVAMRN